MRHKRSNAWIVNIMSQKYFQIYLACLFVSQNRYVMWIISKSHHEIFFFDSLAIHSRHEKRFRMFVRLFCLFQCSKNQQCSGQHFNKLVEKKFHQCFVIFELFFYIISNFGWILPQSDLFWTIFVDFLASVGSWECQIVEWVMPFLLLLQNT